MEIESVRRHLLNRQISITSHNKWLIDCISWFKSNPNLSTTYGSLQEYVTIQWLLSDLRNVQSSCLPNVADGATVFSGKYAVQINWMRNIGESSYSQYRSIKHKDATMNDEVTAEETKKQSWEPNPKRVLMMEITDGVKTMKAMEYGSIPKLGDGFLPGMKILLKGPIECRRKILFLKNSNVDIFGGEVEELYEVNRAENVLSRCLNLPELRPNPTSVRDGSSPVSARNSVSTNGPVGNSQADSSLLSGSSRSYQNNASTRNRPQVDGLVSNDRHLEPLPENNLISPTPSSMDYLRNNSIEDMDTLEDDDDFLNQVPDEMLDNDAISYDQGVRQRSPVLCDEIDVPCYPPSPQFLCEDRDVSFNPPSPQPGPSNSFQAPSRLSSQRSLKINKTKRFPSLDVSSSERESDSTLGKTAKVQSTLKNFISTKAPSSTSSKVEGNTSKYFSPPNMSPTLISDSSGPSPDKSLNSPVVPFIPTSSSTCVKNAEERSGKELRGPIQPCNDRESNVKSRGGSDYEHVNANSLDDDCIMEIKDIKEQKCKVINILKLRVKDQKWTCEIDLNIDGESKKALISDKVAVGIFGIEAAKMESLKKEILTNPRTKQEMNQILQAGGAKIKSLDCLMTLEYSNRDSVPVITSINNNR